MVCCSIRRSGKAEPYCGRWLGWLEGFSWPGAVHTRRLHTGGHAYAHELMVVFNPASALK
jgi:hypothetical protein